MQIGFSHASTKCYCRKCYHIYTISWNECREYIGGNQQCPTCGEKEQIVRSDCVNYSPVLDGTAEHFIKNDKHKLKILHEEKKELERIKRLLENHENGWYPPEDYP